MKKIMMIGSALMMLSTSVFATEARLIALGMKETDNEGMYYIQDGRNIFLNSANVNNYADQIVTEYGNTGLLPGGSTTQSLDQVNNAKAQGGVFKKYGGLVYGLYYGNESNTSALLRFAATTPAGLANPIPTVDNQLDLFVAGEAAVKWGANVTYAQDKNETTGINNKSSAVATRLGVIGSNWDAHANISLKSDAESDTGTLKQEFDGKLGLHVGGSYLMNDNRLFGYVKHYGWDQKATGRTTLDGKFTSYYLGWGRGFDVNESDKLFASVAARKTDIELNFATKAQVKHLVVPVTLGYEAKATEWLTLRGSIVQNLYGKRDNKALAAGADLNAVASTVITTLYGATGKATVSNSTEVNAGASLYFGQLTLDGVVGLTAHSRTGTNGTKNTGLLAGDDLLSKVGLTYKF